MTSLVMSVLLRLYPRSYRRRYGDQWRRTAQEMLARESGFAVVRTWLRIVGDAVAAAPSAHGVGERGASLRQRLFWDIGQSARALWRRPRFTATCIIVLGIGMGVNAAVFSVANSALLRPLDYPGADRLALVWGNWRAAEFEEAPLSPPQLAALGDADDVFENAGGIWASNVTITDVELPLQISLGWTTASFFPTLDVPPSHGRLLRDDDAANPSDSGSQGAILLSHAFWQRYFGGDLDALGTIMRLDGTAYEVVGILPERFRLLFPAGKGVPDSLDVYAAYPPLQFLNPAQFYLRAVARLQPGVDLEMAAARLEDLAAALREQRPELADSDAYYQLQSLQHEWTSDLRLALIGIQVGALLLLLLTLTNVTSLMVAQAVDRLPAFAVRVCLGADRRRLARQLIGEGALLAGLAVIVGGALGTAALAVLWAGRPSTLQRLIDVGPDLRVVGFGAAMAIATVVCLAAGPVLLLSRSRPSQHLVGRGAPGVGRMGMRMRRAAVTAQIASTFALLVAASLMARTVANLQDVDSGFQVEKRLAFDVSLSLRSFPEDLRRAQIAERLRESISELPGVQAVGGGSHVPLARWVNWAAPVLPVAVPDDPDQQGIVDHRAVTSDYFAALGASVSGREFDAADNREGERVAVVDTVLAGRLFGDQEAIGEVVEVSVWHDAGFERVPARIVGVVNAIRDRAPDAPSTGQVYLPFAQTPRWAIGYVVEADRPTELVEPIRRLIAEIDESLAGGDFRVLSSDRARALAPSRFAFVLSAVIGVAAALLSAIGVYGVLALETRGRAHEIGIRLAVGARAEQVFRMVLGAGMRLATLGLAVGVPLALGFATLLRSSLFGIDGLAPWTLAPAVLVIACVGALAAALPALQATRRDPVASLRAAGR